MKNYIKRIIVLLIGVVLMSLCGTLLVIANIGSDAIMVFQQGLTVFLNVNFSIAIVSMNLLLLAIVLIVNRKKINVGTILVAVLIGPLVDLFLSFNIASTPATLLGQVGLVLVAILVGSFGVALYIHADMGLAAVEALVVTATERFKISYALAKVISDVILFVVGALIGGVFGLGSIIATFIFGPFTDFHLRNLRKVLKW